MTEFGTFELANGVRCIHRRVRSAVAYIALTINTGSRDELPNEEGMAHLTEHLLFKGTERRRAWQVNCRLENLGGELNAYTTKEETVIHATTLRSDWQKATELIADIVFRSTFPEKELTKEKQVIFDEINLYKDSPSERIFDEFEELLFDGSSLGHNILGQKTTLKKHKSSDIKHFTERTYNTDQMVVSLIGNISEKAFRIAAERYFGEHTSNKRTFERIAPSALPSPIQKAVNRSTYQTHCVVGNRAYSLSDPKRLPLALVVNMLGGPAANSLLNIALREDNALSYTVEANYTPFTDSGIATIYFSSIKGEANRCKELIYKELDKLKTDLLSPRRLAIAKRQFIGQLVTAAENNESYMLSAARNFLLFGELDDARTAAEKVNTITAEDIRLVANEIFSDMSVLEYK